MPVNDALLVAYKTLYLVQESMRVVRHTLDDNPSPADALEMEAQLSDLTTLKDELTAMRDQLRDGESTIPPPDDTLMNALRDLIFQVEQATKDGAAAGAVISLAGQALSIGMAVMSRAA